MQFFVWGINRPDVAEARAALRPEHWDYIDRFDDTLIARGPVLNNDLTTQTIGSIHILDLPDWEAARDFAYEEPYAKAGLFEDIVLHRFENQTGRTQFQFDGNPDHSRFFLYCAAAEAPSEALIQAHEEYCRKFNAHFICRGALLNDDGAWTGAAFFVEFSDAAEMTAFMAKEPFSAAGAFEAPRVHRWTQGGRRNLNASGGGSEG